jgi:hypothetical protein
MYVCQVAEVAREWVEVYGSQTPGFCGAHFVGSINTMPQDAPFPPYRDVDVKIVRHGATERDIKGLFYKGLILECSFYSAEEYSSPEAVLSSGELAANMAVDSILVDPTHMLTKLHHVVAQEYARRKWIVARCENQKKVIRSNLDGMGQTVLTHERVGYLALIASQLSGLIALASLEMPTVRRSLVVMKELLQDQGRLDLHEALLSVLGYAHLSQGQVESYLQECIHVFDRAVEVKRTPSPLDSKLHAHVRPYFVEGTQEMINAGDRREAMIWIAACYIISIAAIYNDAPAAEKQPFLAGFARFLRALGMGTPDELSSRMQRERELVAEIFTVAEDIVNSNPALIDSRP